MNGPILGPALVAMVAMAAVIVVGARLRSVVAPTARRPPGVGVDARVGWPRWACPRPSPPDDLAVAAWCRRVAAAVRSGSSLTAAVVDADGAVTGGVRPFPDVVHAVRRGRSIGAAFREVPADPADPSGLAAPVLATCADVGGPSTGPLEAIADVLVARADERAERHSASAQARLSARVMTIVPIAVAAVLTVGEPSFRAALASPVGATCVAVGLVLDLTGWWWMHSMVRAAS